VNSDDYLGQILTGSMNIEETCLAVMHSYVIVAYCWIISNRRTHIATYQHLAVLVLFLAGETLFKKPKPLSF